MLALLEAFPLPPVLKLLAIAVVSDSKLLPLFPVNNMGKNVLKTELPSPSCCEYTISNVSFLCDFFFSGVFVLDSVVSFKGVSSSGSSVESSDGVDTVEVVSSNCVAWVVSFELFSESFSIISGVVDIISETSLFTSNINK